MLDYSVESCPVTPDEISDQAATGRLALLHPVGPPRSRLLDANNSYNALNRIIGFYPVENRPALLQDLASATRAIVSQRLVKAAAGGTRQPAVEIMLNTRYIADLIEKGELSAIKEAMDKSLSPGSQSFEHALLQMVQAGLVTQEEALANADSATNLLWLLNNGPATPDESNNKPDEPPAPTFTEFTLNT